MSLKLTNSRGERLDCLVEGNQKPLETIVFVHGIGTGKDESFDLFVDFSNFFKDRFRIIRFDLSGCGKSEGDQIESNYNKWAGDLEAVLEFSRTNFPEKLNILAQSMGCFVTLSLNPPGIQKTAFLGIPNSDVGFLKERFISRIRSRLGSEINFEGTTLYPRTRGGVQKIGPSFWQVLEKFDPLSRLSEYAQKTEALVVHYRQDEIIGSQFVKEYDRVPGVKSFWFDGDHSLARPEDRQKVMREVKGFFLEGNPGRG